MPTTQIQSNRGFQIRLAEDTAALGPGISVHEEDNYGLLVSPPQVSIPIIVHPLRLYTELYDFSPYKLGSLRIQGNKILAIVVDVAQDPPCRSEWVSQALCGIFQHTRQIKAHALDLPLLGHRHGGLPADTSLRLIVDALLRYRDDLPPQICLRMARPHMQNAYEQLAAAGLMENRLYFI